MAIRTQSRYRYTSDSGTTYSVVLADDIGTETGLGFTVADGSEQNWPQRASMRYVQMIDPATGNSKKRPVGTLTAAAWATPLVGSYALDQWNDAADVSHVISSRHGEKFSYGSRPVPI